MFSRYFLILCAFGLFATVIVSAVEEEVGKDKNEDDVSDRQLLGIAVRVLAAAFRWAATHCLEQAANNCKQHWRHPKELINCARGFLEANRGRCATG